MPVSLAANHLVGGRYRLVRLLARGGMAEVWEANDEVLTRPVAVKILLPHLAADDAFLVRFRREAVAAARLSHPHIVAIYDTCSDCGVEAIVMELVRGSTLRAVLDDNGALNARRARDIAVQVADALEAAHRQGLVHRDVKPGNILLSDDGRVLVADFGIAKAAEASSDLTEVGQVVGTAKYLSPEQVEGGVVDGRSDVYALAVVLYEMLCGRPPFTGETSTQTALARLTTTPLRPRQVRADIPRALEEAVLKAMARSPADRPTATEFRAALSAVELAGSDDDTTSYSALPSVPPPRPAPFRLGDDDRTPVPGSPPEPPGRARRPPRRRRRWAAPLTLVVVVVGVLGLVAGILAATDLGQRLFDGDDGGSPDSTTSTDVTRPPPTIAEVRAFDPPPGGGDESNSALPKLTDGDPATAWTTEGYASRDFGNLKDGVGVLLQLAAPSRGGQLAVTSTTQGWAAAVYVAGDDPADLAGFGEPVATGADISGSTTFDLGEAEGSVVLLWLTDLGTPSRTGDRPYLVTLGEISLAQ
jgi:serine/threonine-protein kinase